MSALHLRRLHAFPTTSCASRFWASTRRTIATNINRTPPLSFVFDIDGVLIRAPHVLPAAKRAMKILEGDNPFKCKIPYILLTNGGGVSETERSAKLSTQLGISVSPTQYIQAHTILKSLVPKYADKPILVLGGKLNKVREVAQGYGFRKVYTTLDVLAWNPAAWPFHTLTDAEREVARAVDFSKTSIAAVFVFHDPRDWALDVQITCDVIRTGGRVGGPDIPLSEQTEPVELVFCNPDLLWKSDFDRPRLGQGAFKEAFQSVFTALTGDPYPYVQFGKPTLPTATFAGEALSKRVRDLYGPDAASGSIYMVGDNPASDISGANAANWSSILVHTGVYDPSHGPPAHTPTYQACDVEEAVNWAIERELRRVS